MKFSLAVLMTIMALGFFGQSSEAYWPYWSGLRNYYGNYYGGLGNYYGYGGYSGYGGYRGRYRGWGKRNNEIAASGPVMCQYDDEKTLLSCNNTKTVVDCLLEEKIEELTVPINYFSVSAVPNGDLKSNIAEVFYDMFSLNVLSPTPSWNSTYCDIIQNKTYNFSLYHSPKLNNSGLIVKDLNCWKKLTQMFTDVTEPQTIKVECSTGPKDVKVVALLQNI